MQGVTKSAMGCTLMQAQVRTCSHLFNRGFMTVAVRWSDNDSDIFTTPVC